MPLDPSYLESNREVLGAGTSAFEVPHNHIVEQTWTDPVAAATNSLVTTIAGLNAAGTRTFVATGTGLAGTVFTGTRADGRLDFARNVVITVTHATAVVAASGTITGLDIYGRQITEAWSVAAGTTSRTFTGAKAFSRVLSITETVAADASGNSLVFGHGQVFGLRFKNPAATRIVEVAAGSVVTNGTIVAASTAAAADYFGTYSPNTAPNGSNDYTLWYLTRNPQDI